MDFGAGGSGDWGDVLDDGRGVLSRRLRDGLQRVEEREGEEVPVYSSFTMR